MRLDGSSALVTGGASGLGAATAARLAAAGAAVVIADLPTSAGERTAADIGVRFVPADITAEDSLAAPLDAAEALGVLRAVVHCAGRGGDRVRILDRDGNPGPQASFEEVLRTNVVGTYNVLRLAAARMAANELDADGERGAIVLTASVAAFDGQIGQTSYAASKAAVSGMTLVAARDLATHAIRVNTIAPGVFDTPMLGRLPETIRAALAANVPHPKRLGAPEDYAAMAEALLTNGYVNGETVRLDGAIRMPPR
jgi:NAD(P)-dependent dehydrogenase (short-subunit alcohol dehydrogenase family)